MSPYKYSATVNEHRARAVGLLMPISLKKSIEICNLIRGINIQKAKDTLNNSISMKKPVPFKRFTEGAGHKHGIGPGKYPVKACREILKLVSLVEANAQHKGLDTSSLEIIHICAKKGPKSWHYGRQSRIAMKRTNVEIVVEEKETKKKEVKKEIKKAETKKPVKEEESKLTKKQEEKKKPVKKVEEKEIKDKPKEEVKEKHEKKIKEEPEKSTEIKEDVETKEQEKIKPKAEETKEKSIENLKEEDHRKIEAKVKEIREKLQQEGKSQKEKVPSAFELAEKKESKEPKKNNKK